MTTIQRASSATGIGVCGMNNVGKVSALRLLICSTLLSLSSAHAATLFWDADAAATTATGGTGNWDTTSVIWRNGSATGTLQAWVNGSDAVFGGTAGTV